MSDVLKVDNLKEGVSILTLNRPEVLNSLNKELIDSLLTAFDDIYVSKRNWIKSAWIYACINLHLNQLKLSSTLIAETTFSSPESVIILTP